MHPIKTKTGRANSLDFSADVTVSGMLLQKIRNYRKIICINCFSAIKDFRKKVYYEKLMNVVLLAALVFTLNAGFFEGFPQVDDYGVTPLHDLEPITDIHT